MADTTAQEELDDHIRSPFQLNKTREKPLKLVSLPLSLTTQNGNSATSPSSDFSPTSMAPAESVESIASRSSSISSNPFSLNIKKVSTLSNPGSLIGSPVVSPQTSTSGSFASIASRDTVTSTDKIPELQKEIALLKKDIEAKDAKLSSSVKSIKQFWSPELKKERALRKEETEKCVALKDKYQVAQSQIEEYKSTLQDLESEFKSQQTSISSLTEQLQSCKQEASDSVDEQLKALTQERQKQDDEIFTLNRTLDDFEVKYRQLEEELDEKNKCIGDLEIILVENERKELEHHADKKELQILHNTLQEQEIDYQMIKKEYDTLKKVHSECSEKIENTLDAQNMKGMIADLENELEKQIKLYQCSLGDVEKYKKSDVEKLKKISDLDATIVSRSEEQERVHSELLKLREKLEESDTEVLQLQTELSRSKAEQISSECLEQKDKEIKNLNTKYEKLDNYLSERENALELCRNDLKSVKNMNRDLLREKETLQNELFEQKSTTDRLQKQRHSFSRPKEDVVLVAACSELKNENEELIEENNLLKERIEGHEIHVVDQNNKILSLQEELHDNSQNITKLKEKIQQVENENSDLTQEILELKEQITTLENKQLAEESANIMAKDEASKKLCGEMNDKDNRIEELERQIKEKTKQITSMKKTQTSERDKQHQLVNESKKIEEEMKNLEEEKQKKDERIIMLEDALRESVTLAVEREDLLAGHKEMYENAVNKMNVVEGEYGRVEMEKAITNIKNAFLIMSLSEKDAFIASMEATRKRSMEELFNMKQANLLNSISEKDNQIAHLELQSSKTKKLEIKQLKSEKEKFVNQLKEQNNVRMDMHTNGENNSNLLLNELKSAPSEQVYEAIRHLSTSTSKLEFYIEELLTFLREQDRPELTDIPSIPRRKSRPVDKLKKLSKDELLTELNVVDGDCTELKTFVHNLLDKLEGAS